jgi:hypothetical protein
MKFAYADPPYFGQGAKRYGHSEWDHQQTHLDLVKHLIEDYPDGWVLSCNPANLVWLLPDCPVNARVAPWVKTFHQIHQTAVQYAWEPVIFCGGRKGAVKPMVRDWHQANATRQKGLVGAKPHSFNLWVLQLLNFQSGDVLDDLYPGTGGMSLAIAERTQP